MVPKYANHDFSNHFYEISQTLAVLKIWNWKYLSGAKEQIQTRIQVHCYWSWLNRFQMIFNSQPTFENWPMKLGCNRMKWGYQSMKFNVFFFRHVNHHTNIIGRIKIYISPWFGRHKGSKCMTFMPLLLQQSAHRIHELIVLTGATCRRWRNPLDNSIETFKKIEFRENQYKCTNRWFHVSFDWISMLTFVRKWVEFTGCKKFRAAQI